MSFNTENLAPTHLLEQRPPGPGAPKVWPPLCVRRNTNLQLKSIGSIADFYIKSVGHLPMVNLQSGRGRLNIAQPRESD